MRGLALEFEDSTQDKVNKNSSKRSGTACPRNNVYLILAFVALTLISLFLRFKILPILTGDPTLTLTADSDSSSYLRLFDLIIHNFPKTPTGMDFYSNYPWGFKPDIPPIWPYLLAVISLPVSKILSLNPQEVAGLLVVLLGTAAAIPIYFLAKELFGKKVGLTTAAVALVHPFFILLSSAAIDHITADIFLVPSALALFLVSKRYYSEGRNWKFAILAVLGGACVALSIMMSLTLILVLSMTLLPVVPALFLLSKEKIKPVLAAIGVQFATATLVLGLLAVITPWFSSSFTFEALSYLHIAVFAAIAMFGGISYLALRTNAKQITYRSVMGCAIIAVLALVVGVPNFREIVVSGYYRSIGSYPLGKNTIELASVFDRGIDWLFFYYSYFVVVIPITIVYLAVKDIKERRERRNRKTSFEHIFFYTMLFALGFYTLQALHYYSPYFSIFAVIAYGLGISVSADFVCERLKSTRASFMGRNLLTAIGAVAAIVVMVFTIKDTPPTASNANLAGLAQYMRTSTDVPGDFYDYAKKPSYSVMCSWADACKLQYLSQRAMVSSANQEIGIKGIIASERFYQATSEDEALAMLRSLDVKYVVAGGRLTVWHGDISKIGISGANPDKTVRVLKGDELPANKVGQLMAARMVWSSARLASSGVTSPLHHFRLLYISYYDSEKPPLLLYEVVKGARVVVKAKPNSPVAISTNISFNTRRFTAWQDSGTTNEHGVFSTIVPSSSSLVFQLNR